MKILYRISDGGNAKAKLSFVYDKKRMFLHFIKTFQKHDIYVFADNVSEETFQFLKENYNRHDKIFRISLGNAKSFMFTLHFAFLNFSDEEKVYFAEDDYVYTKSAADVIEEGLNIADYSSGYDHPDKYINANEGGNPFIEKGGESTRVMITNNSHWKLTNSCCMTFASTVKTLKEDYELYLKNCSGWDPGHPYDFGLFCDLYKKNRTLVSSIPGVSTHGEIMWLTKFVDWEKEFNNSMTY
jgi:hypothetical protein